MQIISSWKSSLQLLKWENIKQLFKNVFASLPRIYVNWFIYGLPVLALIAATAFIYVKFGHDVIYSHELFLMMVSFLSSFVVITLCMITRDVLYNQKFNFARYKKYLIIGTIVLSIFVLFILWYLSPFSITEIISSTYSQLSKRIEILLSQGKDVPPAAYKAFEISPQISIFLLTLAVISIGITALIQFASYILFFFFYTAGSLTDFLKSIGKAIKFIFLNVPFLIIVYGIIFGLIFLTGRFLNTALLFEDNFYGAIFLYIIEPIILMPFFVALAGVIYKQFHEKIV